MESEGTVGCDVWKLIFIVICRSRLEPQELCSFTAAKGLALSLQWLLLGSV